MFVTEAVVQSIAVCYPTESLSRQVALWARDHEETRIEPVFGRSALEIRRSLHGSEIVLVDATDDHAQAIELFAQSVARLGPRRVAVYTENMHDGLELFVRTQGAWLLLGPLTNKQWEDFFSSLAPRSRESVRSQSSWRRAA
jgi:hypothetical protein